MPARSSPVSLRDRIARFRDSCRAGRNARRNVATILAMPDYLLDDIGLLRPGLRDRS